MLEWYMGCSYDDFFFFFFSVLDEGKQGLKKNKEKKRKRNKAHCPSIYSLKCNW